MMKQIWLVRHAKSDWGSPGLPDFERPLNARGLAVAPAMGGYLAEQGVSPQLIVCSPARRARQTAELIAQGIAYPVGQIQFEQAIYEASPETLLDVIAQVPDEIERLMVVGHNPGMTLLVNMLGGALDNLSTCSVVSMGFASPDWDLLCYPPKNFIVWRPKTVLA